MLLLEGKGNYGYNAATGEYGDMIEAGILDPTKVTRYALQNAASVSGLLLTTEAMVADAPQDDAGGAPADAGYGRNGWHGRHDVNRLLHQQDQETRLYAGFFLARCRRYRHPSRAASNTARIVA